MTTDLMDDLTVFEPFLATIDDPEHQVAFVTVLNWVHTTFPQLKPRFAWNQPMFTDHDTFIIGFSVAKPHFSVALEKVTLDHFHDQIVAAGDETTKMLWKISFAKPVNYALLTQAIQYNLDTKIDTTTFWRK